jgi:dethiobiotin synthetase
MTTDHFVAGTDTGVGKTLVSALLCVALDAYYWKPIQTGVEEGTDRRTVIELAGLPEERTFPECYVFDPPVSPHLAAEWAGAAIDLGKIRRPSGAPPGSLIAEGAGGVMVPVNNSEFMLDLMRALAMPVLVVSRSALGTINHTVLTLNAIRAAGLGVHGVVVVGHRDQDNERAIERYGNAPVVGRVPLLEVISRETLLEVFNSQFDRGRFN